MGKSNIAGGNGKLDTLINGVIEQYTVAAGEEINAGDFVEKKDIYSPSEIRIKTDANARYATVPVGMKVSKISEELFIIAKTGDTSKLYCRFCSIYNSSQDQEYPAILLNSSIQIYGLCYLKENYFLVIASDKLYLCSWNESYEISAITNISFSPYFNCGSNKNYFCKNGEYFFIRNSSTIVEFKITNSTITQIGAISNTTGSGGIIEWGNNIAVSNNNNFLLYSINDYTTNLSLTLKQSKQLCDNLSQNYGNLIAVNDNYCVVLLTSYIFIIYQKNNTITISAPLAVNLELPQFLLLEKVNSHNFAFSSTTNGSTFGSFIISETGECLYHNDSSWITWPNYSTQEKVSCSENIKDNYIVFNRVTSSSYYQPWLEYYQMSLTSKVKSVEKTISGIAIMSATAGETANIIVPQTESIGGGE